MEKQYNLQGYNFHKESFFQLDSYQMCFFKSFNEWGVFLQTISIDDVKAKKKNVENMKFMFLWENLITSEKLMLNNKIL